MREINSGEITKAVAGICGKANCVLPADVLSGLIKAGNSEISPIGQKILDDLVLNAHIAREEKLPICQDTGLAVVFVDLGQDVHIVGGGLEDAINQGIRNGYQEALLRKSVVSDPLYERVNTKDNTPAIVHLRQVPGSELQITLSPKGGGCENKSFLRMLVPADGENGVKQAVLDAVRAAGASACPPFVLGVGIGGNSELAMLNAKRALLREITSPNPDSRYQKLENDLLDIVNASGIGPQGFGGSITALKVNVETAPTHIASLPVAVSIGCHATRHAGVII